MDMTGWGHNGHDRTGVQQDGGTMGLGCNGHRHTMGLGHNGTSHTTSCPLSVHVTTPQDTPLVVSSF